VATAIFCQPVRPEPRPAVQSPLVVQPTGFHAVCKWIGNTAAIAAKHYLAVREEDYERAAAQDENKTTQAETDTRLCRFPLVVAPLRKIA
jgi:hypothetical protein